MKKLFISCAVALLSLPAFAANFAGALSIFAKEMYGTREPITVQGQYIQDNPSTGTIETYTWELNPIDADGNIENPIYSQTFSGDPTGSFTFPEEVTAGLPAESYYSVNLIGMDNNGAVATSGSSRYLLADYTFTTDNEICCGTPITGTIEYSSIYYYQSYQIKATMCDANGNSTSNPIYDSQVQQGYVEQFTIPNSENYGCDQYYRIDVDFFYNPMLRPYHVSKVVFVTSYILLGKNTFCAGQNITAGVSNCPVSQYITDHQWMLQPCGAMGQNPGAAVYTSGLIPGANGNTEIIPGTNLLSGYYLLTATFHNGSTTVSTRTKVIYMAPPPAPVITGPTNICGTGSYCVTGLSNSALYNWSACTGNIVQWSGNTSCVTVPAMAWNNMILQVTDGNGCTAFTSQAVTNDYITPDFYLWNSSSIDANHFKPAFQRASGQGATIDAFTVEEVSSSSPYTAVSGSSWSNPGWSNTSYWYTPIYFYNYNGDYNPPNSAPSGTAPYGYFRKDRTYRVTRTINNSGCISSKSIVFDKNGVICNNCRTMQNENSVPSPTNENGFDIFPNPSNGVFQINFSAPVENANAELINMLGERVDAFTFSGNTYSYSPTESLAHGVYLLRINNNGTLYSKRIVIE